MPHICRASDSGVVDGADRRRHREREVREMRRTTALAAAGTLSLVPSGLFGPTPTAAIVATGACRGEPATIVGVGGRDILGTEGRDVVITNRPRHVIDRIGATR